VTNAIIEALFSVLAFLFTTTNHGFMLIFVHFMKDYCPLATHVKLFDLFLVFHSNF
jgi:hypothetical protein